MKAIESTSILGNHNSIMDDELFDFVRDHVVVETSEPSEKFVSPCPLPTPHERELLDILIEECSEIIQRATKMKRFGVLEIQPGQDLNNAERLALECGDFAEVARLVTDAGMAPWSHIKIGVEHKQKQLAKYMQTTKDSK